MKQNFLLAMDIKSWKPRYALPGAKPEDSIVIYRMQKKTAETIGYLFVSKYFDSAINPTAISNLLGALFKATGLTFHLTNNKSLQWSQQSYAVILGYSLEEQVKNLFSENTNKIVTEDPVTMINNPACKRKVWKDLQPLVQKE